MSCDQCVIYKRIPNFLYCPMCSAPLKTNATSNLDVDDSDNMPIEIEYDNVTNYNQRNEK